MVALRDDAPPGRSRAEAGAIAMLRFTLSVAPGSIRLEQTFAELFESKHSALVVARSDGEHRLVSFDHITEALAHGATTLNQVNGVAPMLLGDVPDSEADARCRAAGVIFALFSVTGQVAQVFSVSEGEGRPMAAASNTVRCDRPNKPAGTRNANWYHYYPPEQVAGARPFSCVGLGCTGTVR
jgi:hypothetical protein